MFVRTKTVKSGTKIYQYYQLVQTVRKNGQPRQEVLLTLGRKDRFDRSKVDDIVDALQEYTDKLLILNSLDDIHHEWSRGYGAIYVMEKLWKELQLDNILKNFLQDRNYQFNVKDAIKGMVFNRAISPHSKHATCHWLKNDVYFPEADSLELHHFYRAMDFLIDHKQNLETQIYRQLTNLFSMDVSVIFYDCTLVDMYTDSPDLVEFSRKGKTQFLVTLALSRDGLPIAHEVLPGNTADIKTVSNALAKLKERFSIEKCIFVSDRGMVSQDKLNELKVLGYDYIVGVRLNQWKEIKSNVLVARGRYTEVDKNLQVKEVSMQGRRYLICYNPQEAKKDKLTREAVVKELEERIAGLDPMSKEAAELYSHQYKGRFLKRLKSGRLKINRTRIKEDEKYDGKYILLTNASELTKEEISKTYKRLWRIERSFRSLKSLNDLEPVYHSLDNRIKAHVFLCVLAHLLERLIEHKFELQDFAVTAAHAIKTLRQMRITKVSIQDRDFLIRTETTSEQNDIFKALKYRPPARISETS